MAGQSIAQGVNMRRFPVGARACRAMMQRWGLRRNVAFWRATLPEMVRELDLPRLKSCCAFNQVAGYRS